MEGARATRSTPAEAASGSRGKYLVLAAMLFAVSMTFIDQTIVSIAVPHIQAELKISQHALQWVVNGYLLALSAAFALGGRISDIYGHRRMVLVGIFAFAVSSALCGATPAGSGAQAWIITFRVVQGAAAALMFPAALAIVVSVFPVAERGRAMALFFGISGGLTAVGPIAGGYLSTWTWRAIFWVNVPVAVVALVLTLMADITTSHRREPLDLPGAALVAAGMALSVLGLQQASSWGWGNVLTWLCILGGLVLLVGFVLVELRVAVPLIDVRIFRDRAFVVDNAVLFFAMVAFVPVFFFASVYSQLSLGFDASNAGLYLLTFFAGFAPAAQVGGRILDTRGAKPAVLAGCILGAVGFYLWGSKLTDLHESAQWVYIVMAGAGVGLLLGPSSTDAVNRSIGASYGEVTGITQTLRNYGSSLGFAVLGTLLITVNSSRLGTSFARIGVPTAEADRLAHDIAHGSGRPAGSGNAPAAVARQISEAVKVDFAHACQTVFYGMSAALVVAAVIATFHPGDRVTGPTADPAPADGARVTA